MCLRATILQRSGLVIARPREPIFGCWLGKCPSAQVEFNRGRLRKFPASN
jgi:hypothetical protein